MGPILARTASKEAREHRRRWNSLQHTEYAVLSELLGLRASLMMTVFEIHRPLFYTIMFIENSLIMAMRRKNSDSCFKTQDMSASKNGGNMK